MLITLFSSVLMLLFPIDDAKIHSSSFNYFMETTTTGIGFGRPTAACDGTGVCFVSSSLTDQFELKDNFGKAEITFDRNGSVSRIHADAKSMTKNTLRKHFSGKNFIMKDPYSGTLTMGGKELKINIPAGEHRITKTKTGFLLEVTG
ncbi:MAG: hypothetical protein IPL46_12060 [Saprospiraceae bacterium]|nr:hypothetical protein [Saprospiraceae bacterium]